MKIRLVEIPQEGRSYTYDRAHGELDDDLNDLIGSRDYSVDMMIKPIGNAYEVHGKLKTSLGQICSVCGYDFEQPIERKISEILFEEDDEYRKKHSIHGNQAIDYENEGPSATPYRNGIFDAGSFVHELVALSDNLYPVCGQGQNKCVREDEAREILRQVEADFALSEEKKPNPFNVLKGLDLSKKN